MKKLTYLIMLLAFTCCDRKPTVLIPGQVYNIPFSSKVAFGTDSTIVIIDRDEGKITAVINLRSTNHE